MASPREADLYEPVAEYLRARGYTVRGEIRGVDIVACRDDAVVAVELKRRLTLDLVLQAVERQRTADSVYVALPAASEGPAFRNYRRVVGLLKRLELGLMLVHFRPYGTQTEVRFHPAPWRRRSSRRERRNIIREFDGRTGDRNTGGSTRTPVVTAYRESAVFVACALDRVGVATPAALRRLGTGDRTQSILSRNYYGWFRRIGRGRYALDEAGRSALSEYRELSDYYSTLLDERQSGGASAT